VFTESVEGLTAVEKNGLSVETEGRVLRKLLHCLGHIADLKTTLQKQSGVQARFETNPWRTAAAAAAAVVVVVVVVVVVIVIMMIMIMIDGDDDDRHYDAVVFTVLCGCGTSCQIAHFLLFIIAQFTGKHLHKQWPI